jgi:hypothetical protein
MPDGSLATTRTLNFMQGEPSPDFGSPPTTTRHEARGDLGTASASSHQRPSAKGGEEEQNLRLRPWNYPTPQTDPSSAGRLPAPSRLPPPTPSQGPSHPPSGVGRVVAPPRPPPGRPPPLPGAWRSVSTANGTYYYNVDTKLVSWQPPVDWLRTPNRRKGTRGGAATPSNAGGADGRSQSGEGGARGATPSSSYSSRTPWGAGLGETPMSLVAGIPSASRDDADEAEAPTVKSDGARRRMPPPSTGAPGA